METQTPQEQPKAESGMDRLTNMVSDVVPEVKEEVKPEPETTHTAGFTEPEVVLEVKPETKPEPELTDKPAEPEFKDESQEVVGEGRALIESLGYQVPEDFKEDAWFETLSSLKEKEKTEIRESSRNFQLADIISTEVPESTQAEARLVLDLLKTGQTLEEITAPTKLIQELRALSPEVLVRKNLEGLKTFTDEEIDLEMERLSANPKLLALEHKKLNAYLDNEEYQLQEQRKQQINNYNSQQSQLKEQRRQNELSSVKAALDRMPAFMDIKLKDDNKRTILKEIENGAFDKISPEDKAEFMLWKKYGKQGVEYAQSRAIEKATLEHAKKLHNIPETVAPQGGNRAVTTQTHKNGQDRLEAELNK